MFIASRRRIGARLGSHERGRQVIEWWAHRRTRVYLLSYPKTGRTWLRLMIGKALDEQFHLALPNPMELGRMHRYRSEIPRIRVSHEDAHMRRPETLERSKSQYRGKTVIFLVRDPRDVVVSTYFEFSRRRELFSGGLGEFLRHPTGSLDTVIEYYNIWAEQRHVPRRFHLVRYEDLHRSPHAELDRTLRVMGLEIPPPVIEAAVEFSRFENMRRLESENAFGSRRLGGRGSASDPESLKTRAGKVHGYREYFSAEDVEYMNDRIAARLSSAYDSYRRGE